MMNLGIDVGGTNLRAGIVDGEGVLRSRISAPVGASGNSEGLIRYLAELARKAVLAAGVPEETIASVGVGIPGAVKNGRILYTCNLPLQDVSFEKRFRAYFDRPVYLENDANCAAAGEWLYGAGRGTANFVMVTLGTGIGGGFILNGKLYTGGGMAGEIGHVRLFEDGHVGYGKSGSYEGYVSGGGIAQYGKGTAAELGKRAEEGDPETLQIWAQTGEHLGSMLAILIDLLNPEVIVIGSIFVRAEKYLRASMEEKIRKEALKPGVEICRIVPAGLGESIGDIAALCVAMNL